MVAQPQSLLFVIVGKNEPLFEAELNKVATTDSITRQNYFVLHSSLDLVDKSAFTSSSMYLKVVDKVIIYYFSTHTSGNFPLLVTFLINYYVV